MSEQDEDESSIAFPSTGDPNEYDRLAKRYKLQDERMKKNICPNGCGQMSFIDLHNRKCPVCGFHGWQNTPIQMPDEKIQ